VYEDGNRLGDFEIVRAIGRGGMGIVYEARQTSLHRRVALKVLSGGLGLTPKAVQRFRREAEAAAKLHHTNIVPVYAIDEENGTHFYAMELIEGPSLDHVIRHLRGNTRDSGPTSSASADGDPVSPDLAQTGPYVEGAGISSTTAGLSSSSLGSGNGYFDTVARMIAEVADALEYAHQEGVIHRDMKPSNLLLSPSGRLSVNDFGLARMLEQPGMTMTGEFVGTPAYMSPEQITAGRAPLNHRTDIYSLGATLYELLTFQRPFAGERRDEVIAQIMHKEPKAPRKLNPKVPVDLETICLKCMEKDPDRRYQTANELAEDLRRYVNRFAILAKRAGPVTRARKWLKRNPVAASAAMAILLALGAAGFFAWRAYDSEQQRQNEITTEKRQTALEKAILSAMSGQLADADTALLEAERLGAGLAERRFVAGILSLYRGQPDDAKRLLLEACGERSDWAAPRFFLSVVCNWAQDADGEVEHGNAALALTPVTPEDFLFRGYMIGWTNPERGLPDVEEAIGRRRSVLAQFIRAEVLMSLADKTGRVEDAAAARDAYRSARALMGEVPMVVLPSLQLSCVGYNNCRRHGRVEEAKQWLAEGAADFRAAEAYRAVAWAVETRSLYLLLKDGTAERLDAENREAGRKNVDNAACMFYLASLFRQGKSDDALEYLRTVRDDGSDLLPFSRTVFLLGRDLNSARAECRRALASGVRSRWRPFLSFSLSLAGMPKEARQQAKVFRENPLGTLAWDEATPFVRRVVAHAYEGIPMDVEGETAGSPWKQFRAYDTLAFAALGRGERDQAVNWFRKAAEHPPVLTITQPLMQAIRERVINDPSWPPWISAKKNNSKP